MSRVWCGLVVRARARGGECVCQRQQQENSYVASIARMKLLQSVKGVINRLELVRVLSCFFAFLSASVCGFSPSRLSAACDTSFLSRPPTHALSRSLAHSHGRAAHSPTKRTHSCRRWLLVRTALRSTCLTAWLPPVNVSSMLMVPRRRSRCYRCLRGVAVCRCTGAPLFDSPLLSLSLMRSRSSTRCPDGSSACSRTLPLPL